MKKIKLLAPIFTISTIASVMPIVASCGQNINPEIKGNEFVAVDGSIKLEVALNKQTKAKLVAWHVGNTNVAKIDDSGKLTGLSSGVVEVYANFLVNDKQYSLSKNIIVLDNSKEQFVEFLSQYYEFLENYLSSSTSYQIDPVGKYEDMEWHDQVIDKIILTKISTEANKHYLRIFTTKQRTFNFVTAGNSVYDIYNMINGLYSDCTKEITDTSIYHDKYYLKETFNVSSETIEYKITAESASLETKYYLATLRINKNGYIEYFQNGTNTEFVSSHAADYGCFEIKYTQK